MRSVCLTFRHCVCIFDIYADRAGVGLGPDQGCIYFKDHNPPHVHVTAPDAAAVFKLDTLECIESKGFSAKALAKIQKALEARRDYLQEVWDEYQEG